MFIIAKYVKIRFKNRRSSCYFLTSRDQKIKDITKVTQKMLFLFSFFVSFFMGFLTQRLTYAINMIDFMFGSLFEQEYLLNVIIKEFMRKDDLNVLVF